METHKSISKIRKAKGYSQEHIAGILNTTQQQYSKYEIGKQEIPVRHIKTLCEYYGISANFLIGIETYMTELEDKNKFKKLTKELEDLIYWANYQEHISEDAMIILLQNLDEIRKNIEES